MYTIYRFRLTSVDCGPHRAKENSYSSISPCLFFPRAYASNISSWRESKATFERIVAFKHAMLKAAGLFLALGVLALFAAMGAYLAG